MTETQLLEERRAFFLDGAEELSQLLDEEASCDCRLMEAVERSPDRDVLGGENV